MASASNQVEILPHGTGRQYGDITVYGNALLGDGIMNVESAPIDLQEQKRQMLIDDLEYEGSGSKRDQLKLTQIGTSSFAWIKDTPLSQWLRHGTKETASFWISGKPGSGKSTLTRYLVDSRSTQDSLDSDGNQWKILHFFYDYRAGSGLGNVPVGMLRTFLLQLLRSIPSLTKHVDDRQIRQQLVHGSIDVFIDILAEAVRSTNTRVCGFIDGLDEYDGQLWELCAYLEQLRDRTGMKMCLASRPEPDLINAFQDLPTITMQEHNDASIKNYIERRLLARSGSHPEICSAFSNQLSRSLREKARGVILWAKLVIDEMLETHDHATTEDSLFKLLDSMPSELGQLYDRLISRLPNAYKGDAILVLNLVTTFNSETLTADILFQALSFIFEKQSSQLFLGQRAEYDAIKLSIESTLGRLFDFLTGHDGTLTVRLIHETLATHLRRSAFFKDLLPACAKEYFGPTAWVRLALNAFACATNDSAFDVSALSSNLLNFLQSRLKSDVYAERSMKPFDDRPAVFARYIRLQEWRNLTQFLCHCSSELCGLLNSSPAFVEECFELIQSVLSSDAMILHLCFNRRQYSAIQRTKVVTAKFLRLWRRGRLDLACTATWCVASYLCEMLKSSELDSSLLTDIFDLVVTTNNRDVSIDDFLQLVEPLAAHGLYMDGKHLCALVSYCTYALENIWATTFIEPQASRLWSRAHDEDCRYHGTSRSLLAHWCEADFQYWLYEDVCKFLWLVRHGSIDDSVGVSKGDSAVEAIFDLASMEVKDIRSDFDKWGIRTLRQRRFATSLGYKVAALMDNDRPPSQKQISKASRLAVILRRRLALSNLTRAILRRGSLWEEEVRSLDHIILVLTKPGTPGALTRSELLMLRP